MSTTLEKDSPCKVNLLLNILGKRPDGFHELETVFYPIQFCDHLIFSRTGCEIQMTCSDVSLPADSKNLVWRAAAAFLSTAGLTEGVRIHLEKNIPQAAGLGGGSGNAATTLLALNELFSGPLDFVTLHKLAATLGSDVPFFLLNKPALATGRGEHLTTFNSFPALTGAYFLLVHPGFGISTAWAYQNLARFPATLNGTPGRAKKLIQALESGSLATAGSDFYNSLEAPALDKYPILALFQDFLRTHGAAAALMSGSGSTTFAIIPTRAEAEQLREQFIKKFGATNWTAIVAA